MAQLGHIAPEHLSEDLEAVVNADNGPLVVPRHNYTTVTEKITDEVLVRKVSPTWLLGFALMFGLMMVLLGAVSYLFAKGVGIWGINIPVGWAFAIVNFVWWIGIGHAGTLISAILLLLHQSIFL